MPSTIGNLVELVYLSLYDNALSGAIPAEIGRLTLLESLALKKNSFGGTLPAELGDLILTNLIYLDIRDNKFTGVFPEVIANATHMVKEWEYAFCFSNNSFTGGVPEDSGDCVYI
jgi:Leucine-rich repeat (LRR) protein